MFKKPSDVAVNGKALLRGKEARALHELIEKLFVGGAAVADAVLPLKAGVEARKLACKVTAYGPPGEPAAFLDLDAKAAGRLAPTLTTLWAHPALLPALVIPAGVSHFLVGGADLMLPGVLVPDGGLPPFAAGALLAVRVAGNPAPLALGVALLSSAAAAEGGMRGRGVRVVHHYGDELWAASGRARPNAGFEGDAVASVGAPEPGLRAGAGVEAGAAAGAALGGATAAAAVTTAAADGDSAASAALLAPAPATAESAPWWRRLSPDELLLGCLLQALRRGAVRPSDLPMPTSTLFGAAMAGVRPAGTELEVKKTSWRKPGAFFAAQAAAGVITLAEKSPGVTLLTAFDASHALVKNHRMWPGAEEAAVVAGLVAPGDAAAAGGGAAPGGAPSGLAGWAPPQILELLRVPDAAWPVVATVLAARAAGGRAPGAPGVVWGRRAGDGRSAGASRAASALAMRLRRMEHVLARAAAVAASRGDGNDDDVEEE